MITPPFCHPEPGGCGKVKGETRDLSVASHTFYRFLPLFGHPGLTPVEMTGEKDSLADLMEPAQGLTRDRKDKDGKHPLATE